MSLVVIRVGTQLQQQAELGAISPTLKKVSCSWHIGAFHCVHVVKSIPWTVISRLPKSEHISLYRYQLV